MPPVPLPWALRPGAAPVPRPAARAVAVSGRHLPDRGADLGEQGLEGLAEAGVEPPGRGLCCWHLTLPGDHSRHAHDISIVAPRQDITRFESSGRPRMVSHRPVASTRPASGRSGMFPATGVILPVPGP